MAWQLKLASHLRASPLRCSVSRPSGAWLSCHHQHAPRHFSSRVSLAAGIPRVSPDSTMQSQTTLAHTTRRTLTAVASCRLTLDNINPNVKAAKYAVRGEIATKAEEYRVRLAQGDKSLPFDSVIFANIGNPQQLDQKPISFFRQVLSLLENPLLLENPESLRTNFGYPQDVIDRTKVLLADVQSVGAYSHSQGAPVIRDSVAKFIEQRDGFPANPQDLFLTAGASSGVSTLLNVICDGPSAGVLVPIPQYPLYTATLSLLDAQCVPYLLDEHKAWGTDVDAIKENLSKAKAAGTDVRAIVVINPGNPTGASLSAEDIKSVLEIAAEERLVVIADEVYQTNVFSGEFISFKKRLRQLQQEVPGKYDNVELASLHSVSKGMVGECGHRGGYFELVGFDPEVAAQIYKYVSIMLCPPVIGQCLVELMVNPPTEGEPSYELYRKEYNGIKDGLRSRALALYEAFQKMEGVECQEPQGAMYLFPTINLPAKAIEAAAAENRAADEFYCLQLLDATGICVVPGSGFGQKENTLHFRTTFLAPGTDWAQRIVKFHSEFMAKYK
ncbi:putative alanine aminotransferase [Aspergillus homomorphus CBS 101889]|uniref:Glutamate pyruvate transaminase n=1 Tax=Aspergillus homomorphus (strain CBS 101889) TaxID=1450537 RepID=A0A395IB96_ASPHC|nr:alanine aminotransferase [Aspergillus homomorphus CBS 101889]RAL16358.1 alanine aminotransferase [Aspergillus homomorphus CBS 101889]